MRILLRIRMEVFLQHSCGEPEFHTPKPSASRQVAHFNFKVRQGKGDIKPHEVFSFLFQFCFVIFHLLETRLSSSRFIDKHETSSKEKFHHNMVFSSMQHLRKYW
jgi:hypothetical protein